MADKSHILTDQKLEEMEKRLSAIYSRAEKEIQKTADDYFSKFAKQDEAKRKLLEQGKITEEEYKKWRKGKVMYGKRFTEMKEQCAKQLLNVNQTALAYVNGELPEVYALNYNALAGSVDGVGGYSFTLVDADTVRNLAVTDTSLLPHKELDPSKDIPWNMKKINAETLQGILQGESMDKIAKRLRNVQEMNKTQAIRSARTIVTGAENKGRQDSYARAEADGIILQKEWLSSDQPGRTRDWHMPSAFTSLIVDQDKPFENSLGKIMFPGDPSAHGANVWNCRCSMSAVVKGFKKVQVQKAMEQSKNSIAYNQTQTLANYDEYIEWSQDGLKYHLENAKEGWRNVPSQMQAIEAFEKEIPHYMQQVEDAMEKFDFSTKTDSQSVLHILKDGRFKSQIETEASHGVLDVEKRKRTTSRLFTMGEESGFSEDAYEIYGYLDNASRASMYGDCKIVLKKQNLMQRTTFTVGDSLELIESGADPFASLASRPSFSSWGQSVFSESIPNAPQQLDRIRGDFSSIAKTGHLSSGNYVELQFHGGVSVEDIDYISLSRNVPNAKEIEELAQKAGVKVKWIK